MRDDHIEEGGSWWSQSAGDGQEYTSHRGTERPKTQMKRKGETHLDVFLPVAISAAQPYEPLCSQT